MATENKKDNTGRLIFDLILILIILVCLTYTMDSWVSVLEQITAILGGAT